MASGIACSVLLFADFLRQRASALLDRLFVRRHGIDTFLQAAVDALADAGGLAMLGAANKLQCLIEGCAASLRVGAEQDDRVGLLADGRHA